MATLNMNAAKQVVRTLNIEAQLIPSKVNPMNCQYIIFNGQKLKTSQLSGKAIKELLEAIINGCSVQEIQGAKPFQTKANIKELIPFNCNINETIREYIKLQLKSDINTLETWQNMFIDFYCINDNGEYNGNIEQAKNKMLEVLANEDVIIFQDSFVFNKVGIHEVITEWLKYNHKQYTDSLVSSMVNTVVKKLQLV